MSKYRASPPTNAHILLTTPQKHPRLASYQLWSHSEPTQARTSRKTAKITFFTFHVLRLSQKVWSPYKSLKEIKNRFFLEVSILFSFAWKLYKRFSGSFWAVLDRSSSCWKTDMLNWPGTSKEHGGVPRGPDLKTPGQCTLRKTSELRQYWSKQKPLPLTV